MKASSPLATLRPKDKQAGFSPMPALGGLGQGKEMFTDVVLWPLFSKDLILMDGRTNRRKRGRKRREGREEEYKLPVLARKSPEVPSLEVPDVSVYLFSYMVLRNSVSLLMSYFSPWKVQVLFQ